MRILLCSLGSHGDIHPYLALGRELVRRGHTVAFATSSFYQALVERQGIRFTSIRPEAPLDDPAIMARIMDARRGPENVIKEHVMPALRDTYQDLLKPATQADLLVSHVLTYAVPMLAEKLCKPWASTVLSPMIFFSAHDVPTLAPLPMLAKLRVLGPRINRWLIRQLKRVSHSWSRPVRELRRELQLPPGGDPLWEGQHSPHLVLAMFSGRFGPPQPDWPPNVHVTGFPFLDAPDEPLDEGLERFVSEGAPPIVFTLGSAAVRVAGDFYSVAAQVARCLNRRAVLVAGSAAAALRADLPPSMTAVEWASYPGLFSRASAVVHQGGVGTTAQALRAGAPQLVVPFAHDQFDNADRVGRLGVGRILRRSRFSQRSLARELEGLLADQQMTGIAAKEGRWVREEGGAARAADVLLERFS
ncbi:MAG: glycosyltransferase [Verrucomicrobiales bacterium]|nr:glycosyltransferase [Verrucomicrobiales bacterium]